MKEKKLKYDESSMLVITEQVGEEQVRNVFTGEVFTKPVLKSYPVEIETSLGSVAKPNKKIVKFEYKKRR